MKKSRNHLSPRLLVLALLLPLSLHAYYNPSTGRWLSRDPAKETKTLLRVLSPGRLKHLEQADLVGSYLFVGNSPLAHFDYIGLQTRCQCGLDVTAALKTTLDTVGQQFKQLPYVEKREQCYRLYDLSPMDDTGKGSRGLGETKAAFAWDITELKQIGSSWRFGSDPPPFFTGDSPCSRTVTVAGGCYYASAVNFAMWGKANRLCHDELNPWGFGTSYWSLDVALNAAALWKGQTYGTWGEEEQQALLFTAFGYKGTVPHTPLRQCSGNEASWRGPFHWFWQPHLYPPR